MIDGLKPGQSIRLTLTAVPRSEGGRKTVARLMRLDPDYKRKLARGQNRRVKELVVRSRGARPWEVRERSAKVVRVEKGASWSMRFFPQIAPDLGSVASCLKIASA